MHVKMIRKCETQRGIQYALEENLHQELMSSGRLLHAEKYIEASEYCISLFVVVSFLITSFCTKNIAMLAVFTSLGFIVGMLTSFSFSLIKIKFISGMLRFFGILQKNMIILLLLATYEIFIMQSLASLILLLTMKLLSKVLCMFITRNTKKLNLHTRLVKHVINY